jgi:uncharacterized repeat protein (TIGR01451 family)
MKRSLFALVAAILVVGLFSPSPRTTQAFSANSGHVAASAASLYSESNAGWTSRTSLPIPDSYFGGDAISGKIYVVGGLSNDYAAIDRVFSYDPASDTWQTLASLPSSRCCMGVIAEGGKLYVAGGAPWWDGTVYGELYAYTPATNTWEQLADMPEGRWSAGMAAWQGKLYVVAGQDARGVRTDTVYEYSIDTNTWTMLTRLPEARWAPGAAVVNGVLYVLGGSTPADQASKVVWGYDLTLKSWNTRASLPMAKWDLEAATKGYDGKLYVVGGYNNNMLADGEVYDPLVDTWQDLPDLPTGRTALVAAVLNGELHAIGGHSFAYGRMADHLALTIVEQPIELVPPAQTKFGKAGDTISYAATLENHTGFTDTFNLNVLSGNNWTTTLPANSVGPLQDGESITITAQVDIPADAEPGGVDTATIRATSVTSPTLSATASIKTEAASGQLGYVTYEGNNFLSIVDTALHMPIETLDLAQFGCVRPNDVQLEPDRERLFIDCADSANIVVLDALGQSRLADIPDSGNYGRIAFTQDSKYALVTTGDGDQVDVINIGAYTITKSIPTSGFAHHVAVHPYLPLAYVGVAKSGYVGEIVVIDTTDFSIKTTVPFGHIPEGISPSPDGRWVVVADYVSGSGIAVIDVQTNNIVKVISGVPDLFGSVTSPDGSRLYVGAGWSNSVYIFNTADFSYLTSIGTGGRAFELDVTCDGTEVFVADHTDTILIIDSQTDTVIDHMQMPSAETNVVDLCPPVYAYQEADQAQIPRGASVNYTLHLSHMSTAPSHDAIITDTLPASLSYTPGSLHANSGSYAYDDGQITWTGPLTAGQSLTITYGATISSSAPFDTAIDNTALIDDGAWVISRTASVTVPDQAIAGLTVTGADLTVLGNATPFTASIGAGTNVSYTWSFGDSSATASGLHVSHTYGLPGDFAAMVTATNSVSEMTATTTVVVDDMPVAADDVYTMQSGQALIIQGPGVLGNDSDSYGSPLTAQLFNSTITGTMVLASSGAFTYTPPLNFAGLVTFTYKASDGSLLSPPAVVTIIINPWQLFLPLVWR